MRNRIIVIALVTTTAVCALFYLKATKRNRVHGWVPINAAQLPFKPGMIINGQLPAEFLISIVEPKPELKVFAKPKELRSVIVNIRFTNNAKFDIPPTFVVLKIKEGTRVRSDMDLIPSAKDEMGYFYSGSLIVPDKIGDYEFLVEAEYAIYDNRRGVSAVQLNPFRKSTKGVALRVRK